MTSARILDSVEEQTRSGATGLGADNTFYFIHLKKAKGEGAVAVENPVYSVTLDRSKGTKLGLKMEAQHDTNSLFIKEVIRGLAFTWNAQSPSTKIKPGDRIISINGIEGNADELMEETTARKPLVCELQRGNAVTISPGLSVSVKEAFGNFKPGMEGTVLAVDAEGEAAINIIGLGARWVCKTEFDKLMFEDTDRYYMKRYCDFVDLHSKLKARIESGDSQLDGLPDVPADQNNKGFRRQASILAMGNITSLRKEALQRALDGILGQVPKLEDEPALAEFFGQQMVPEVGAAKKDILLTRLKQLVAKHRGLDEAKKGA